MKNFNRDFTAAVIKASEEWVARPNPTFDASHFENDEQVAFIAGAKWMADWFENYLKGKE